MKLQNFKWPGITFTRARERNCPDILPTNTIKYFINTFQLNCNYKITLYGYLSLITNISQLSFCTPSSVCLPPVNYGWTRVTCRFLTRGRSWWHVEPHMGCKDVLTLEFYLDGVQIQKIFHWPLTLIISALLQVEVNAVWMSTWHKFRFSRTWR